MLKGRWWGREWFTGIVLVAGFALTLRLDPLAGIEGWLYGQALRLTAPVTSDDGVVIIATDDLSQAATSLPQERTVQLLERLHQASPRAVAMFWPEQTASVSPELSLLGREAGQLLKQQPQKEVVPLLQKVALLADGEQRVSKAMRGIDHLILAAMPTTFSWTHHWQ